MRPLPQRIAKGFGKTRVGFLALLTAGAWTLGCGGGGAVALPPPPPPSITVSVTPPSGSVVLGNQITFTATVTNATDTSVSWTVNGVAGGNSVLGTISSAGVYTAPTDLPSPTAQQPDAPLADDDRTGLRVLYPDPADTLHQGSISGRIIPANPLALPAFPPGVTGVFGAQVVAVDNLRGAVIGAMLGGWSCAAPGPAQFDGTYQISGLPVGGSYTVYAEALNGAANPSQFSNALTSLCRNAMTDAGWPPLQACIVPAADTSFTTRTRPGP